MSTKLIVIRKKDLTVAQLDGLKENDAVKELRGFGAHIMAVVDERFKSDLVMLDIDAVFDALIDRRVDMPVFSKH